MDYKRFPQPPAKDRGARDFIKDVNANIIGNGIYDGAIWIIKKLIKK